MTFQLFYETTRTLLTNADDDIKTKGTEMFNHLVTEFHKGGKQFPMVNRMTENIFAEMFFYRFGLLKYYDYMGSALDYYRTDTSMYHGHSLMKAIKFAYEWLNSLEGDFDN